MLSCSLFWFCLSSEPEPSCCKFFTYVTKTCANLTTYSRKPENYNDTIIFEIDIMKKSTPINLNLCQTWLFHKFFGCKCFTYVTKTIANLTTYSRKPGNYNGINIFEIDIMKNSSPLNLKFTFFAMSKPK